MPGVIDRVAGTRGFRIVADPLAAERTRPNSVATCSVFGDSCGGRRLARLNYHSCQRNGHVL